MQQYQGQSCYEQALLPSNAQVVTLCLGVQANEANATPSQLHRLKRQRQTAEGGAEAAAGASVPQQADGAVGKSSEDGKSLSIQGEESAGPASLLLVMPQTLPAGSLAGQHASTVSSCFYFPSCEHPSSSCLCHLLYRGATSMSCLHCLCFSSTWKGLCEVAILRNFC